LEVERAMKNEKFLAARKRKRWTQEKVSELTGVSVVTVSRWENGLQQPHATTLDLVCTAFGMSPAELGFEADIPSESSLQIAMPGSMTHRNIVPVAANQLSASALFNVAIRLLELVQQQDQWPSHELLRQIELALGSNKDMAQEKFSRRHVLELLVSLYRLNQWDEPKKSF
jgi:transcriptional regulator with XRE-family HTH domain